MFNYKFIYKYKCICIFAIVGNIKKVGISPKNLHFQLHLEKQLWQHCALMEPCAFPLPAWHTSLPSHTHLAPVPRAWLLL